MRPSRTKRFRPTRSMYCNLFIPFINSRDFHGHDHFTSMLFPRQGSHHPTAAMNCPMINFGLYLLRYLVAEFGLCLFHNEFILFVAQYKFSPEKYHSQHFTRDLRCEIILTLESIYGSALFYNSANLNLW